MSNDLKWSCHISEIPRKVTTRLYFLKQLKRAGVATKELVTFYTTCICPVMQYSCSVCHINSLPNYLSDDLEFLQERAMRISHPFVNPEHKLHKFLAKLNKGNFNIRNTRKYHVHIRKNHVHIIVIVQNLLL